MFYFCNRRKKEGSLEYSGGRPKQSNNRYDIIGTDRRQIHLFIIFCLIIKDLKCVLEYNTWLNVHVWISLCSFAGQRGLGGTDRRRRAEAQENHQEEKKSELLLLLFSKTEIYCYYYIHSVAVTESLRSVSSYSSQWFGFYIMKRLLLSCSSSLLLILMLKCIFSFTKLLFFSCFVSQVVSFRVKTTRPKMSKLNLQVCVLVIPQLWQ